MIDTSAEALRRHSDWLAVMCGPEHPICYTLDALAKEKEAAALAAKRTAAAPDVVERVARAIADCDHGGGDYGMDADAVMDNSRAAEHYRRRAASALSALRPGDEVPAGVVVPRAGVGTIIGWHDWMVSAGRDSDAAIYAQVLDVLGLSALKGGEDA